MSIKDDVGIALPPYIGTRFHPFLLRPFTQTSLSVTVPRLQTRVSKLQTRDYGFHRSRLPPAQIATRTWLSRENWIPPLFHYLPMSH